MQYRINRAFYVGQPRPPAHLRTSSGSLSDLLLKEGDDDEEEEEEEEDKVVHPKETKAGDGGGGEGEELAERVSAREDGKNHMCSFSPSFFCLLYVYSAFFQRGTRILVEKVSLCSFYFNFLIGHMFGMNFLLLCPRCW